MKKIPYGIVICQNDDTADLRKALIDAATRGPFRNLTIHVPPAIEIDSAFGMKFADLAASLAWAIGMAEEAITVRETGDDEADTPDVIAMHRAELEKARLTLSHLRTCIGGDAVDSSDAQNDGIWPLSWGPSVCDLEVLSLGRHEVGRVAPTGGKRNKPRWIFNLGGSFVYWRTENTIEQARAALVLATEQWLVDAGLARPEGGEQ